MTGEIHIPDSIEEGTRAYLEVYQNIENNEFNILYSVESLKGAWSKAKENMSAAPGLLHYETMKTMKWCMLLAKFKTIMSNILLKTSKPLQSGQRMSRRC